MTSKLPPASDHQARAIRDWNCATFLAYITETTREKYGVDYAPGGGGSKQARWNRERGMLKNAQGRYGNAVLRAFIEICWREYRTNKPELYPYPSVNFMIAYMDRHFAEAQSQVARASRAKAVQAEVAPEEDAEWW